MEDEPKTESSPKRTRAQIDEEYTRCCTLMGDKSFKVQFLTAEITLLIEKMRQLNMEVLGEVPPSEGSLSA